MSVIREVREVFDSSQHLHKHQKCLKQMQDLYEKYSKSEQQLAEFKAELRRDILFTLNLEPKSPYTKHTIEFLANFLRSFSVTKETPKPSDNEVSEGDTTIIDEEFAEESAYNRSDQENRCPDEVEEECDELGMESFGSESFNRGKCQSSSAKDDTTVTEEEPTFADDVTREQLIRFLMNTKTHIRYNCCLLIKKMFADIEDMDLDVYNSLKKALLERLRDKDKSVRSVAALALHRFQEVDDKKDKVIEALKFHLNSDPDFRVRQSCLLSLHPNLHTIDEFIGSTRDVKDIIRKTAFTLIADKFNVKNFEIEKRLQILKNGLNERQTAVKKVVEIKLIPTWIKSYGGDLVQLLYGLDIQSDPLLIEKMLFLYFDHINKDLDESSDRTGFHVLLNQFRERFLEVFNLLTKEELTVENAFLWRIVAKYCIEKSITETVVSEAQPMTTDQEMADSQEVGQKTVETVDAIDTIVPDLPHYCRYLQVFVRQLLANEFDFHQLMEFEFMFTQLLLMGELIDIGDEAQRQILRKSVIELLENKELFIRIHNYIPHLVKIFAKNSDLNLLLETALNTIDSINSESIEIEAPTTTTVASQPEPPQPTELSNEAIVEQLRQFELEYAKLSVRVEALKDDFESARNDGNEFEAQKIDELIQSLNLRINEVMEKRKHFRITNFETGHQSSQQSTQSETKPQKTLTDDPIALERCLQIFSGCLEFGDFKTINGVILTLVERLVLPSIPNEEPRIKTLAVKTLGLVCLLAPDLARKYFMLFYYVLDYDSGEAQETGLQCIFDILCIHGLSHFEEKPKDKRKSSKSIQNSSICSNQKSRTVLSGIQEEDIESDNELNEDNDKTIITADGEQVLASDSDVEEDDGEDQSFFGLFTHLLEKYLNSDSDSIKLLTAQGIGKLFVLGRMYSTRILSKLLILFYDTDSSEELRQFLGAFLPIYSGVQMKANLKGENAFEECFIETVEAVFDGDLHIINNIDNMINFILELISEEGHKNLAKSVANKILTRMSANGVDDSLSIKHYLRVLSVLRLTEMSSHDIKDYKLLVKKIEKQLNRLKTKTKLTSNRLQTIKTKIDKQLDLIKENATQTSTFDDFGSLSLSQSLSQSLSERSQVEETILESDSPKD